MAPPLAVTPIYFDGQAEELAQAGSGVMMMALDPTVKPVPLGTEMIFQ